MSLQEKLWKLYVVACTKVVYNENELLQLIYLHLNGMGLSKTAEMLLNESSLCIDPPIRLSEFSAVGNMVSTRKCFAFSAICNLTIPVYFLCQFYLIERSMVLALSSIKD